MKNGSIKNGTILSQSTVDPEQGCPATVAQGGILALGASIPQYNNKSENQYSLRSATIIPKIESATLKEILAQYTPIMTSTVRREVYFWFLEKQAGIPNMILTDLSAHQSNIYRELYWLKKNEFIESYGTIKVVKKSGPKPILYGLPDLPKELIARSIITAQESYTNVYKVVRELTQRIFEDIKFEEIQFQKIVNLTKRNSQGFYFLDIANMVAGELHNKGIKVWR